MRAEIKGHAGGTQTQNYRTGYNRLRNRTGYQQRGKMVRLVDKNMFSKKRWYEPDTSYATLWP
jgi:hypothetical protein